MESMAAPHVYRHMSSEHFVFPFSEGTAAESANRRFSIIQVKVSMVKILYSLLSRGSVKIPKLYLSVSFAGCSSEEEDVSDEEDSSEDEDVSDEEDFSEEEDVMDEEDFSEDEDVVDEDDFVSEEVATGSSELEDGRDSLEDSGMYVLTHVLPSHSNFVNDSPMVTTEPLVLSLHSSLCSSAKFRTELGKVSDDAPEEESPHAKKASERAAVAKPSLFMFIPSLNCCINISIISIFVAQYGRRDTQ